MTTTTDTTNPTALRLVRISSDYPGGLAFHGFNPAGTDDERTFYARDPLGNGNEMPADRYVLIVVPDSDPRSPGMWALLRNAPDDGQTYRAWNVERQYVTDVEPTTVDPESTPAEITPEMLAQAREEGRQQAADEFQAWKDRAVEIAHQYANDNELCGRFDQCMAEIGLPTRDDLRPPTYAVSFRVSGVPIRGNAGDLSRRDVWEAVREWLAEGYGTDAEDLERAAYSSGSITLYDDDDGDEIASW